MRVLVEDKNESMIYYYFPRVYGFIESAIFTNPKEEIKKKAQDITKLGRVYNRDDIQSVTRKSFMFGMMSLLKDKIKIVYDKSANEIDNECRDQLNKYQANNNKILVHCAMGMSRSASIVIMYLMKRFHISFESVILL